MKLAGVLGLLALTGVQAHYTFPRLTGTKDWEFVRRADNYQSNGFVGNVNSEQIRCFQSARTAAKTRDVTAGSSVSFDASPNIFHAGPLSGWLAKVPAGQTAETFDGAGAVWFKVSQETPSISSGGMQWLSLNKGTASIPIPKCIQNGEYLLRIEHIGLHGASTSGSAQFYISCAQVRVTGGSGSAKPANLVSFPGAYKASDPGIMVNIYTAKSYTPAGPAVFKC